MRAAKSAPAFDAAVAAGRMSQDEADSNLLVERHIDRPGGENAEYPADLYQEPVGREVQL